MSDNKHSETIITNEETRHRRDWIERALASVRKQLPGSDANSLSQAQPARPKLYVVGSGRDR
jgi:hypothetical protein